MLVLIGATPEGKKELVGLANVTPVRVHGPMKNEGAIVKGEKRHPGGRPPGSVNKISRQSREAVLAAAEELGPVPFNKWKQEILVRDAPDGIKQFYKALAVNLRTFGAILARMMPIE
jgi:hypothetical protein